MKTQFSFTELYSQLQEASANLSAELDAVELIAREKCVELCNEIVEDAAFLELHEESNMSLEEAMTLAKASIPICHEEWMPDEWMIVVGDKIQFEDGFSMPLTEWLAGKDPAMLEGWSRFEK